VERAELESCSSGVEAHYQIVVDREGGMARIGVRIEVAERSFSDIMAVMLAFTGKVSDRLGSVLGLRTKVTLVERGTAERTQGKARRVIDHRDLGQDRAEARDLRVNV
jgi:phenylacetate-CoA ligase